MSDIKITVKSSQQSPGSSSTTDGVKQEQKIDRRKAYKLRHAALGLCRDCPRPIFKYGLCKRHAEATLKRMHKKYKRRKREGLCPVCGGPREEKRRKLCVNCREKYYKIK